MLAAVFAAAAEQVRDAGGILAGGHTSATRSRSTGSRSSAPCTRRHLAEERARPGDALFLTKPLGNGLLCTLRAKGSGTRRARGGHDCDDDAEPRGGGRAAAVLAERRHGRHGLRAVRSCARDGRAERGADRARRGRAARARRVRSSCARRACEPAAIRATASSRPAVEADGVAEDDARARLRPADRGRAARSRCRPTRAPCWRRRSQASDLFLTRIGRVEEGAGRRQLYRRPLRVALACGTPAARQLASAVSLYVIVHHRRGGGG